MSQLPVIFKRELASYFATPLAYVFIVIFLVLSGVFTFYLGGFFESGQANLSAFFNFHPWLYLFLVPAIAMRLWAEERKSGSIELLMTLPITRFEAVTGKFLAAWVFAGIALLHWVLARPSAQIPHKIDSGFWSRFLRIALTFFRTSLCNKLKACGLGTHFPARTQLAT